MKDALLDFWRQNWKAFGSGLAAAGIPLALALYGTAMSREDTATKIRLEEYQAIADTQEEFNRLLNRFTASLTKTGTADPVIVDDLSSNISTLYSKVTAFSPNLGAEGVEKLDAYRTALADVKTTLLVVEKVADMDPLGVDLAQMYVTQRDLTPVLARAAGKVAVGGS